MECEKEVRDYVKAHAMIWMVTFPELEKSKDRSGKALPALF